MGATLMIISNLHCSRRHSGCAAFSVLLSLWVPGMAHAAIPDDYPARAIRLISPFTPRGGNDIVARTTAAAVAKSIGQSVVVDNRPGANSIVGMELAAKSAPDGYTMIMESSALAVNAMYVILPDVSAGESGRTTNSKEVHNTDQPATLIHSRDS